tara:strand:+ start:243 stop:473 length:231 start_codon:yes stop_codon:yes gene_type:complete
MQNRPLYTIAADIRSDWKKVNYAAVPYLDAMQQLNSIDDNFILDSAKSIVRYFLSNATTWRGEKAREIKAELKAMI